MTTGPSRANSTTLTTNLMAVRSARERMGRETVRALAAALDMRDPYTGDHHRRVSELARAIAQSMRLGPEEIEGITLAASLHDIGKLQVPGDILTKPGQLTLPELALVQTHCQAGYDILVLVEFPWPIAEMVLQHHERLDGSGYPKGLTGPKISIGAKIIAVADVFQSMTTHRPYRAARSLVDAIDELERGKGRIYDATAVEACLGLPECRRSVSRPINGAREEGRHAYPLRLTLQQTAVLQLLAQGRSVKEIARSMDLGIGTVKTHLSHAYAALGARNRIEALVRAGFV